MASLKTILGSLSRDEKLAAMDLIWQELSANPKAFASPPWHAGIIDARLRNPDPRSALPLAEAKAEVQERLGWAAQ